MNCDLALSPRVCVTWARYFVREAFSEFLISFSKNLTVISFIQIIRWICFLLASRSDRSQYAQYTTTDAASYVVSSVDLLTILHRNTFNHQFFHCILLCIFIIFCSRFLCWSLHTFHIVCHWIYLQIPCV